MIKNRKKNISAEPGDIVIDVNQNNLTTSNSNSNYSNNLELSIVQQDFIDEDNTSHTKKIIIPTSEFVRLAYLNNNYYDKTNVDSKFNVTVEKQSTPESGSAATYIVKQNGSQVGSKINIPKDFLIKSASLKTVSTANNPVNGYSVGDKYIDFVINSTDNSETDNHIYINVKDLVDVYKADERTLRLDDTNTFHVKAIGLGELDDQLRNLIENSSIVAGTGLSKSGNTISVQLSNSINSDSEVVAATSKAVKDVRREASEMIDRYLASVYDGGGTIDLTSKADVDHSHGNINNDGTIGSGNGILITDSTGKIISTGTISKSKISDFDHTQASSTITDSTTYPNIGNTAQTQAGINYAINSKLGTKADTSTINTQLNTKVDKVNGKGLSTNDFTNALKTKLEGITIDSSLSSTSTNPVQNKIIYNSLSTKVDKVSGKELSTNDFTNALKTKLENITVDSSLSSTSTNSVQNKIINEALSVKEDIINTRQRTLPFINRNRIMMERLYERMADPSANALYLRPTGTTTYYVFTDNVNYGTTTNVGAALYLDGAVSSPDPSKVSLKNLSGDLIGEFVKRGSDPAGYSISAGFSEGIYHLYAEVVSQNGTVKKSNILTVFSKDPSNLLNVDLWSGTEYTGNTKSIINSNTTVLSNNKYSSIGEKSVEVTTGSNNGWVDFRANRPWSQSGATTTLQGKIDIFIPTGTCTVKIIIHFDTGQEYMSDPVTVSANPYSFQTITTEYIRGSTSDGVSWGSVRVVTTPNTQIYLDNVRLKFV